MQPPTWSIPHRIAFRIGFAFAILMMSLSSLGWIPGVGEPWRWAVNALASLLGLPEPSTTPTGSGDTLFSYLQLLLVVVLALGGGVAWSVLDRRRTAYPRLARAVRLVLRYGLALIMLGYGFSKILDLQFGTPHDDILAQRVGDKSPMGLLWTFMGSSRPYTIFSGLAEVFGAVLLLWRRTATAGALVLAAVMTNVVLLNFCYDVPVKLFSCELLLASLVLVAPDARRVVAAVLGDATQARAPEPRWSPRVERLGGLAKVGVVALIAIGYVTAALALRDTAAELDGGWDVQQFSIDNVERPPLTTDADRWARVFIGPSGISVRSMTDVRVDFQPSIDYSARTLRLERGGHAAGVLTYLRPDRDHLVLDGTFEGKRYHIALERIRDWPLMTRGFHWIQESPFNRRQSAQGDDPHTPYLPRLLPTSLEWS